MVLASKLEIKIIFIPRDVLMPSRLYPRGLKSHFNQQWEIYNEGLFIKFANLEEDIEALYAKYVFEPMKIALCPKSKAAVVSSNMVGNDTDDNDEWDITDDAAADYSAAGMGTSQASSPPTDKDAGGPASQASSPPTDKDAGGPASQASSPPTDKAAGGPASQAEAGSPASQASSPLTDKEASSPASQAEAGSPASQASSPLTDKEATSPATGSSQASDSFF